MNEKDNGTPIEGASATTKIESPNGLDLNPRPPRTVRVSKRAAGFLLGIGGIILCLFAYGGYKRQQNQVATLAEGNAPRNVSPATAAGAEIAKDVLTDKSPNAQLQRESPGGPGLLQAPGVLQPGQVNALQLPAAADGQVFIRQAPAPLPPVSAPIPGPREPTPEERRVITAYEREQQAIAAPTTLRSGFGAGSGESFGSAGSTRTNGEDAAQIAALMQSLSRQQNGSAQPGADAVRSLLGRSPQSEGDFDQNMQDRKEAFLAKSKSGQTDNYLKSTSEFARHNWPTLIV